MPERRIVLKNCGAIDPGDIGDYMRKDGFRGLSKARGLKPEAVIEEVKRSGLRGRGGAGFPCGVKWELARKSEGSERFLICNADEGEMGTFKDRYIIENDPFPVDGGNGDCRLCDWCEQGLYLSSRRVSLSSGETEECPCAGEGKRSAWGFGGGDL